MNASNRTIANTIPSITVVGSKLMPYAAAAAVFLAMGLPFTATASNCIAASSTDNSPVDGLVMCYSKSNQSELDNTVAPDSAVAPKTLAQADTEVNQVNGSVFFDRNLDAVKQAGEYGTGLALCAKLVDATEQVVQSVAVSPVSGRYQIQAAAAGDYQLVISSAPNGQLAQCAADLASAVPMKKSNFISTQEQDLRRAVSLQAQMAVTENFGLMSGSQVLGKVLQDAPSMQPNAAMQGISVNFACDGRYITTAKTNQQGEYQAFVPSVQCKNGATITVATSNPAAYVTVGASTGNTAGAYHADANFVAFQNTVGQLYHGVNFASFSAIDYLQKQSYAAVCNGEDYSDAQASNSLAVEINSLAVEINSIAAL